MPWIPQTQLTRMVVSDECSVGKRIGDIIGPVFVAVRHVKPTVGVPKSQSTQNTSHQRLPSVSNGFYAKRGPSTPGMGTKAHSLGRGHQGTVQGELHVVKQDNGTTAYMEQKICAMWGGVGEVF